MWLTIAVIALLALAAIVWWLRRRPTPTRPGRKPGRPGAPSRPGTPVGGPQPGEIWWADVPYEDGTGHKVRPCLVLRGRAGSYEVLKITSQDQSHRRDHIVIPTRTWDSDADHDSYLDLTDPIRVPAVSFSNRAGALDASIWRKVRTLHKV
ncbi:type II toxin-antitoxin system PemK/MazF family toxin [Catellatospora tritici]|uniref:type II toxin-antitoxin system PemK/MazF family toxin n=1 Tax=Catellatospora tritici TaxID=2851566 RepID=UPI001C2CE516|nr:type II toxin-antitoxin system PemK/MazF family toxin [Catellatospora tritici]MBV1850332.1 type II toxin-antitoxin system PemK/MazF family toxin [Catellatospora tritici]